MIMPAKSDGMIGYTPEPIRRMPCDSENRGTQYSIRGRTHLDSRLVPEVTLSFNNQRDCEARLQERGILKVKIRPQEWGS